MMKKLLTTGFCMLASFMSCFADFMIDFTKNPNPFDSMKSLTGQNKNVRFEKGAFRTNALHGRLLYMKEKASTGRFTLTAHNHYRSGIGLVIHSNADMSRYWLLSASPYNKTVHLLRFDYGSKKNYQKTFTYPGDNDITLVLDCDGKNITAWINGKKLITVPDHGTPKEGYTGIVTGFWTYASFTKLAHTSVIPVKETSNKVAANRMKLDIKKSLNWDISKAYTTKNGLRTSISLNQLWEFQPVEEYGMAPSKNKADWGYFLIPGNWAQGIPNNYMHLADGTPLIRYKGLDFTKNGCGAWLRRTFKVPEDWKGKKIELLFNNVNSSADFYVNGKIAAKKKDSHFMNVRFDITKFVRYGAENEICVMNGGNKNVAAGFGDVKLNVYPNPGFGQVRIDTDVPSKKLTLNFHKAAADPSAKLRIVIRDKKRKTLLHETKNFAPILSFNWIAPELWSPENPALYDLEISLEKAGKTLDKASYPFGFRTFEAKNGHFYLNGHAIMLKTESANVGADGWWSMRYLLNPECRIGNFVKLKKLHYNSLYFHEPPTEEIANLADKIGLMLLVSTPKPSHRDLSEETEKTLASIDKMLSALSEDPEYYRHPSMIGFLIDVWYCYNAGCTNPNYVGQRTGDPNTKGVLLSRRFEILQRIEKLHRKYFPKAVCFTGGSGAVGSVYGTHIYHTWGAPSTELRAFYEKWNKTRPLPIFAGETFVPYIGSFYEIDNFHGGGKPLVLENTARIYGNDAYSLAAAYTKRPFHDFSAQTGWFWNTQEKTAYGFLGFPADASQLVDSVYLDEIIPGWRYHRLTGAGMFDYSNECFSQQYVKSLNYVQGDLSRPGFKPEFANNGNGRRHVFNPLDQTPDHGLRNSLMYAAFKRNFQELSLTILDSSADPLLQDHSGFSGEIIEKNAAIYNDTLKDAEFKLNAMLRSAQGSRVQILEKKVKVAAGEHKLVPIKIRLPETAERTEWVLDIRLTGSAVRRAAMNLQVFPQASSKLSSELPLFVYDPEGKLVSYLKGKISFKQIKSLKNIPQNSFLIIGRDAVSKADVIPDFDVLAGKGINTLIMEQSISSSPELMKTRTRRTFINDPAHPVLRGLENADFSFWKGSHSLMPSKVMGGAGINWSDWGNRNMVCGAAFRRPQYGAYKSLIVSGFDLFQTPLLEKTLGHGKWIASQLEMTERLGKDPVPTKLFANLVSHLGTPVAAGKTLFFGKAPLVEKFGIKAQKISELTRKTLADADTLLIASPDYKKLIAARFELAEFVYAGGKVIFWQTDKNFDPAFLPFTMKFNAQGTASRRAAIYGKGDGIWRSGWNEGDLYWHDKISIPVFEGLPSFFKKTSPAVIAAGDYGQGKWIFTTLSPENFAKVPAAQGKTVRTLSALLTSCGIEIHDAGKPFAIAGDGKSNLDLVERKWEFAIDPNDIGIKEGWQFGKNGSGKWLKGLIADGIEVRVGQAFENFLLKQYDGYAWYRLTFDVPENLLKKNELYFVSGGIDDVDVTFLNGKKIGETTVKTPHYWIAIRNYKIPAGLLKAKNNILLVRVQDLRGGGGMIGLPIGIHTSKYDPDGQKLWSTPWPTGAHRDYYYKSDIVRMY